MNAAIEWIPGASALLVDGHDTEAAAQAARWAREEQMQVVGDFDIRCPGVEKLLEYTDFAITSKNSPERLTAEAGLAYTPETLREAALAVSKSTCEHES